MGDQPSGVLTAFIAGIAALGGTIGGAYFKGDADQRVAQETAAGNLRLSQQKFYSDLVLKAVESSKPEERQESLTLLAETKLISDPVVREAILEYAAKNKADPQKIPQFQRSSTSVPTPVTQNARLFLLAGTGQKATQFEDLQRDFGKASYQILGAKVLNDTGRPDLPEIRYFNGEDESGANQLREFMRERLKDPTVSSKRYEDRSAKPGYIEVWLGR